MSSEDYNAPEITVARGNPVIIVAHFEVDPEPDMVDFRYKIPGSERPYVDDGYGQTRSRITRLGSGVYRYVISTKGFDLGSGEWSFTAEWKKPRVEGHSDALLHSVYHVR